MRLIDADELVKCAISCEIHNGALTELCVPLYQINNAPTVEPCYQTTSCLDCKMYDKKKHNCPRFCEVIRSVIEEKPQDECKDCETCEDKAKQYSLGFQDGYLLSGFQLTELRRWLIAQGYSEGTVDDKIEDFCWFVKRVREDEG